MRALAKKVAFLCLLLTLWSAWAFVAHHHSSDTDAAQCSVCIAAHSASAPTYSAVLTATFVAVSVVRVEHISVRQRFAVFALSVRPPPSI